MERAELPVHRNRTLKALLEAAIASPHPSGRHAAGGLDARILRLCDMHVKAFHAAFLLFAVGAGWQAGMQARPPQQLSVRNETSAIMVSKFAA